jgi:spore germination protein GerM
MNAQHPESPRPPTRSFLAWLALIPLLAACLGGGAVDAGTIPAPAPESGSPAPATSSPAASPSSEPSTPTSPPASSSPSQPASSSPPAPGTPEPTDKPVGTMESVAYFLIDDPSGDSNPTLVPVSRVVPRTEGVGRAALEELLAGPTELEACCGISTAIPEGTLLLGLDIKNGLATVDLSKEYESGGGTFSMGARLAQVVYTLTRFPTVERVTFKLDGEPVTVFSGEGLVLDRPVTRENYVDYLPTIFIDSPAWGASVKSPFEVRGVTNVFEAQFAIAVYDDGDNVVFGDANVMATCGSGCWGTFSEEVRLPAAVSGRDIGLRVLDYSARDGSPENIRDHPLGVGRRPDLSDRCTC